MVDFKIARFPCIASLISSGNDDEYKAFENVFVSEYNLCRRLKKDYTVFLLTLIPRASFNISFAMQSSAFSRSSSHVFGNESF